MSVGTLIAWWYHKFFFRINPYLRSILGIVDREVAWLRGRNEHGAADASTQR